MKRFLAVLLMLFILSTASVSISANTQIKVAIDGQPISFDVQPTTIKDRTMVPLRAVFEALGATVIWDNTTQTVTATKNNTQISLTIDNNIMTVNNKQVILDVPATLVSGRTMVPIRAVSEAFGCQVDWYNNTHVVDENVITDYIVSVVTNENTMYQAFIDFVKTNGTYKDGVYSVSKEYQNYDSKKGAMDYSKLEYSYDTAKKSFFVVYTDGLFNDDGSYIIESILIPISKKSSTYEWIYTEQSSAPFFLQGYGIVKATTNRFHADSDITAKGLLKGRELWSGYLQDNTKLIFSMFDLTSEEIFIQKNSLLRLEYFGI